MNLKEIIQKIFEPNYIKIYKQIEQAFFNRKRFILWNCIRQWSVGIRIWFGCIYKHTRKIAYRR